MPSGTPSLSNVSSSRRVRGRSLRAGRYRERRPCRVSPGNVEEIEPARPGLGHRRCLCRRTPGTGYTLTPSIPVSPASRMPLLFVSLKTVPHTPPDAHEVLRRRRRGRHRRQRQKRRGERRRPDVLQRSVQQLLRLFLQLGPTNFLRHFRYSFRGNRLLVVDAPFRRSVRSVVRFLLVNNHCISDPTAGVTQSLRTIMEWLADAGHACHILTTARFESAGDLHHRGSPAAARRCDLESQCAARPAAGRSAARRPACRPLRGQGRAGDAAADAPQRRVATRSRRGRRNILALARRAPRGLRSRSADRVQRASDDPRGDGARAEARHHHRVRRSRIRLLRARGTSRTSITPSRAASS